MMHNRLSLKFTSIAWVAMEAKAGSYKDLVKGEFLTDGNIFVLQLANSPLSGVGQSASAAYENLLEAAAKAGSLTARIEELARDQRSEAVRAALVRSMMLVVIALVVVGGALGGAVALAPRVAVDIADTTLHSLGAWAKELSPEARAKIAEFLHGPTASMACPPATTPAPQ